MISHIIVPQFFLPSSLPSSLASSISTSLSPTSDFLPMPFLHNFDSLPSRFPHLPLIRLASFASVPLSLTRTLPPQPTTHPSPQLSPSLPFPLHYLYSFLFLSPSPLLLLSPISFPPLEPFLCLQGSFRYAMVRIPALSICFFPLLQFCQIMILYVCDRNP